jgi:hypothetical protein
MFGNPNYSANNAFGLAYNSMLLDIPTYSKARLINNN